MTLALHGFPDFQPALDTADLRASTDSQVINGGGFATLGVLDMRPYSSFLMRGDVLLNVAPTSFNSWTISMGWFEDQAATVAVYEDTVNFWAGNNTGSGFDSDTGRIYLQDVVHGPYFQAFLSSNGADQCVASLNMYGHTRSIPGQYLSESRASAGTSADTQNFVVLNKSAVIGVGVTNTYTTRINPGMAYIVATATGAPITITITGAIGTTLDSFPAIAGLRQQIVLPKDGLKVAVANAGGAPATFTVRIIRAVSGVFT